MSYLTTCEVLILVVVRRHSGSCTVSCCALLLRVLTWLICWSLYQLSTSGAGSGRKDVLLWRLVFFPPPFLTLHLPSFLSNGSGQSLTDKRFLMHSEVEIYTPSDGAIAVILGMHCVLGSILALTYRYGISQKSAGMVLTIPYDIPALPSHFQHCLYPAVVLPYSCTVLTVCDNWTCHVQLRSRYSLSPVLTVCRCLYVRSIAVDFFAVLSIISTNRNVLCCWLACTLMEFNVTCLISDYGQNL